MKVLIKGSDETPEVLLKEEKLFVFGYCFPEDPLPFFGKLKEVLSNHIKQAIQFELEYINSASFNSLYKTLKSHAPSTEISFIIDEDDQVFIQKIEDLNLLLDNDVQVEYIKTE